MDLNRRARPMICVCTSEKTDNYNSGLVSVTGRWVLFDPESPEIT